MIDLSDKSDKQAALARRLLKSEIKRMMRHSKFKALSTWECLQLLLDSMENGTSQYRHQVWELREELKRILNIR
jgi:hypothetical protein